MAFQPMHSTPIKKNENSGFMENSHLPNSGSGSSGVMSMNDLETTTVEKQRKELQLLITELKDRDRELNDMVAAHQQQLAAWERDRQRVLLLEKKNEKFEVELKKRTEQIRLLIQRLKVSESKHKSKDSALESTQVRMKQLEKDISVASYELQDLKDKNVSLNTSLTDVSSKINNVEAREQELAALLRIKEKELRDSCDHVTTLSSKLRMLDCELQDSRRSESRSRAEIQDERSRYKQTRTEIESLKAEMLQKTNEILSYRRDISKLKDEIHRLQKDIYARDDEIRRKDDLIDLQKSKQERADKELAALRLIYERQQQELTALHISLSDSQDLLEKQEERLNHLSGSNLQKKSVSFLSEPISSRSTLESDSVVTPSSSTEKDAADYVDKNHEHVLRLGRSREAECGDVTYMRDETCEREVLTKKSAAVHAACVTAFKNTELEKNAVEGVSSELHSKMIKCKGRLNGLDLSDFEDGGSDTTNDLLEEARRSATSNDLIHPDLDEGEPSRQIFSHSSPTSKLQRLLAESREMVHNLERAASTPVPRPNSARATTGQTSY